MRNEVLLRRPHSQGITAILRYKYSLMQCLTLLTTVDVIEILEMPINKILVLIVMCQW